MRRPCLGGVALACAAAAGGVAHAQEGPAGGLRLTPLFVAEQTLVEYRARPLRENGLESVTRIAPGLRISARTGALQGSLSYTANVLHRSGLEESVGREVQNTLEAAFQAEAVRDRLFVDASASIAEQAISALGQPVGTGLQANANRTEVRTATLSPFLRAPLGREAQLELRWTGTASDSRAPQADRNDSRSTTALLALASQPGVGRLGWGLTATRQRTDFRDVARPSETDRVNASIVYSPDIDWRFTLSGGRERSDVGVLEPRDFDNVGAGLQWTPSPRTSIALQGEDRYFGRSYRARLQYRTPRTVWSYNATRDTTNGTDALGIGQPQSLYQLLFDQFAAVEADPARREQLVLDFLRQLGRDPGERVVVGVLAGGISLQQRHDLGVAWQGRRLALSVQAFRTSSRQLDAGGPVADGQAYAQRGYTWTLSYRLTPKTSTSAGGSRTMTEGRSSEPGTDLKSAFASVTTQLGRRTSGALQARYSVFNSPTDPYRETLVAGSVSLRF